MAQFARILLWSTQDDIRFLCLAQKSSGKVLWNFPGGKVELGESALDAAIREVREELGLRCKKENLQLISQKRIQLDDKEWVGFFYLYISPPRKYQIREKEKITEVKYLTLDEMQNCTAIHGVFSDIARMALSHLSTQKQ